MICSKIQELFQKEETQKVTEYHTTEMETFPQCVKKVKETKQMVTHTVHGSFCWVGLESRFSKFGPWTSGISITWEIVRNPNSQVPLQT